EADPGLAGARGSIVKRNASISPWNHTLDVRYTQTIPIWKIRTQLTAEVENLMNLFDSDSGQVRFVNYSDTAPIDLSGYEGDTPIYRLQSWMFNEDGSVDAAARWTVDDIRSRWRAKLGIRFSF
ncbi:MAG: hypothetical protein GY856_45695, partial [bacterium]|nr:hypothetical protein [bacterium]